MSIYRVETTELTPHLQQMRAMQKEDIQSEKGSEISENQPLNSIPCDLKIKAIKEGFSIEMQTLVCGKENSSRGTTELCSVCNAAFKDVSSKVPELRLTMAKMEEKVEAKPLSFFQKYKTFAKAHPYATTALAAFWLFEVLWLTSITQIHKRVQPH